MTGSRGVDVVLNSLAGEALRQTWHCVAPFGRFIEIGKRDVGKLQIL
jgi:NADPH:quinone reductase-like Zn-dependent oxidoreductase